MIGPLFGELLRLIFTEFLYLLRVDLAQLFIRQLVGREIRLNHILELDIIRTPLLLIFFRLLVGNSMEMLLQVRRQFKHDTCAMFELPFCRLLNEFG